MGALGDVETWRLRIPPALTSALPAYPVGFDLPPVTTGYQDLPPVTVRLLAVGKESRRVRVGGGGVFSGLEPSRRLCKALQKRCYGKVVVMQRSSREIPKTLDFSWTQLSISTGCPESEDRPDCGGTESG